ncbi:MAG: hypothetical protein EOM05_11100 [Clostridia bacterium]|nr:hypothetical protein [Clostridia bacterium]
MRKVLQKSVLLLIAIFSFGLTSLFAQVPQAINFQAIARDGDSNPMVNTNIQIRLSVVDETPEGTVVYQELRALQTNAYGSFSFQIGVGANFVTIGTMQEIEWENGSKFLKIDYDPTNTFTFSLTLGTIEFVTVPYAFAAETVVFIDATGVVDGDVLVYNEVTGKFEPGTVTAGSVTWDNVQDKPDFATVATSGDYDDLLNVPEPLTISVSENGDTLYFGNGTWIVIPGISFTNSGAETSGTFTDSRDGTVYEFVTIGTQVWMAENLKYLPSVVGPGTGSETIPYYYVYDYDGTNINDAKATTNYATYGVLYNWPAAMAGATSSSMNPSGVQGACPSGWHLPSEPEWAQLGYFLGGENIAAGRLKETGTEHWNSPNIAASNEFGFTAIPGGRRASNGVFDYIGSMGHYFGASEAGVSYFWARKIYDYYGSYFGDESSKQTASSVRCIKN